MFDQIQQYGSNGSPAGIIRPGSTLWPHPTLDKTTFYQHICFLALWCLPAMCLGHMKCSVKRLDETRGLRQRFRFASQRNCLKQTEQKKKTKNMDIPGCVSLRSTNTTPSSQRSLFSTQWLSFCDKGISAKYPTLKIQRAAFYNRRLLERKSVAAAGGPQYPAGVTGFVTLIRHWLICLKLNSAQLQIVTRHSDRGTRCCRGVWSPLLPPVRAHGYRGYR